MEIILDRVGSLSKCEWIRFESTSKKILGRSVCCDVQLLSIYVSRKHAQLKRTSELFLEIIDLQSMHGIWLNGSKIDANVPYTLKAGDQIIIGKPLNAQDACTLSQSDMFIYEVKAVESSSLKKRGNPSKVHDSQNVKTVPTTNACASTGASKTEVPAKRIKTNNFRNKEEQDLKNEINTFLEGKKNFENLIKAKEEEYAKNLSEKNFIHHEMEDELKQKIKSMKSELESMRDKEERMKSEMKKLEEAKVEEARRQVKLEEEFRRKEEEIRLKEEGLKLELQRREDEVKKTVANAEASAVHRMVDSLENELQCAVCNELFIKATTLNCAHTFCELCINQWMGRNKGTCPICRVVVSTKIRSLVLDNTVASVVLKMSPKSQAERQEIVEKRGIRSDNTV